MSKGHKIEAEGLLRTADNFTSPVAVAAGDYGIYHVSIAMPRESFLMLKEMAEASGQNFQEVISKAFLLYKFSAEAFREGKSVGIASNPDVLETEFVGL